MQQENEQVLVDVGPRIQGKCGQAPQVLFQPGPPPRADLRQMRPAGKHFSYSTVLDLVLCLEYPIMTRLFPDPCLYSPALLRQDPGF